MRKLFLSGFILCGTAALAAAEPKITSPDAPSVEPSNFTWGGDVRLRSVYFDAIPYNIGGEARGGESSFQRYRTRLWGDYQATDDLTLHGRIVNEFRTSQKPGHNSGWNPMDEFIIDNLYVDWKAGNNWSLRAGRQDLIYGTGKLILDGTPKDGSRTIYFDALKATYSGIENTTIDVLGMYTRAKDPLAMHSEDRDITGKTGSDYEGAEAGGGIYLKNNSIEALPFETYYLLKFKEEAFVTAATGLTHDDENRHTAGARLMPKFSDSIDGNLEVAYQFGDDIQAYMIDSIVNWQLCDDDLQPTLGLGWYHLSGDDPSTSTDEGWNPLWARWPQYSELYVYSFDTDGAGRWSNLSMPHIDFTFHPHEKLETSFLLGYMLAPEKDSAGGGRNRGLLATMWNRFTLKENLWANGDKLSGHVLLEVMDPGNYYTEEQQQNTALFARLELNYSF